MGLLVSFIQMISLQTTRRLFFQRPKVSLLTSTPSRRRKFLFGNLVSRYRIKYIHTTPQGREEYIKLKKYVTQRLTASKDQGPRTKDHGPCFGTNEHPRRDTDVIFRLSKALIEIFNSRSVLIEFIVKMMVNDRIMILYELLMKTSFCF